MQGGGCTGGWVGVCVSGWGGGGCKGVCVCLSVCVCVLGYDAPAHVSRRVSTQHTLLRHPENNASGDI